MFKVVLLLKRRPQIEPHAFAEVWPTAWAHAPTLELVRHVHNVPIPRQVPIENISTAALDGIDEFWFDTEEGANQFFARSFLNQAPAELVEPPLAIAGEPKTLWTGEAAADDAPVKIVVLAVRRAGMDKESFVDYWMGQHASLALAGPTAKQALQRLEFTANSGSLPRDLMLAPFDGMGSLLFRSPKAMQDEFASDYYREVLAPDEPRFTDPARSLGMPMLERLIVARS